MAFDMILTRENLEFVSPAFQAMNLLNLHRQTQARRSSIYNDPAGTGPLSPPHLEPEFAFANISAFLQAPASSPTKLVAPSSRPRGHSGGSSSLANRNGYSSDAEACIWHLCELLPGGGVWNSAVTTFLHLLSTFFIQLPEIALCYDNLAVVDTFHNIISRSGPEFSNDTLRPSWDIIQCQVPFPPNSLPPGLEWYSEHGGGISDG
jgi:hypothetical protein